jgi:methylthioribose-1-phosphate isomerase
LHSILFFIFVTMARLKTIEWLDNAAVIVDQTLLPTELVYRRIEQIETMRDAIKQLQVRGAPAIGIAGAFGVYLGIRGASDTIVPDAFMELLDQKCDYLASSRPTAVNLSWAINRVKEKVRSLIAGNTPIASIKKQILAEALAILDEDRRMCRAIGDCGYSLLGGKKAILTHCNAGGLATSEYGTALAPVYVAAEKDVYIHVYADETRPLLQGARITAFELKNAGIPVTLICDNMAATVMARGLVEAVIVGADRIAANGDTANKIGTYGVALLARDHQIPFYVAAPSSTFDLRVMSGKEIPIEERDPKEITNGFGKQTAPDAIDVFNPAFDVTPNHLITAFITDRGIVKPPYLQNLSTLLS